MQNSTVVFQLNISNKTSFRASISRPNAKPRTVTGHAKTTTPQPKTVNNWVIKPTDIYKASIADFFAKDDYLNKRNKGRSTFAFDTRTIFFDLQS